VRVSKPGITAAYEDTTILFEGQTIGARRGESVAATLTANGHLGLRLTATTGERGLFCGMGVCSECAVRVNGEAGRLIERALQIDPSSPQALFFGAAAALRRGELPLARTRFTRLLALDPPASVKAILERQIAAIDQKLAAGTAAPSAPKP